MERAEAWRPMEFNGDMGVRRRWFTEESFGHPAKMHLGLLQWLIDRYTAPGDTVMDPMAGSGGILLAATLQRHVIARDVEPRFLAMMHDNAAHILREAGLLAGSIEVSQADARDPWGITADHVITSPPYGNAASTTPNQRRFLPYKLATVPGLTYDQRWRELAASPSPGMAGAVNYFYGDHPAQVGHLRQDAYWEAMEAIYRQAQDGLRRGGTLILVVKDHVRHGQRIHVADRTEELCVSLGFRVRERHKRLVYPLSLWQRRRKERGEPVVEDEDVLVFTREEVPRG